MIEEVNGAPFFFLSYAHPHSEDDDLSGPGPEVEFYRELSRLVTQRAGLAAGRVPGFMDISIEAGRQWNLELRTAVGTCHVFVALLSPSYFLSKWCVREWNAFSRRCAPDGGATTAAIVPVIWTPFHKKEVPAFISDVQYFVPHDPVNDWVAKRYTVDGLHGMHYMRGEKDAAYPTVLWRLAAHIVNVPYECQVKPLILAREELGDDFEEA